MLTAANLLLSTLVAVLPITTIPRGIIPAFTTPNSRGIEIALSFDSLEYTNVEIVENEKDLYIYMPQKEADDKGNFSNENKAIKNAKPIGNNQIIAMNNAIGEQATSSQNNKSQFARPVPLPYFFNDEEQAELDSHFDSEQTVSKINPQTGSGQIENLARPGAKIGDSPIFKEHQHQSHSYNLHSKRGQSPFLSSQSQPQQAQYAHNKSHYFRYARQNTTGFVNNNHIYGQRHHKKLNALSYYYLANRHNNKNGAIVYRSFRYIPPNASATCPCASYANENIKLQCQHRSHKARPSDRDRLDSLAKNPQYADQVQELNSRYQNMFTLKTELLELQENKAAKWQEYRTQRKAYYRELKGIVCASNNECLAIDKQ